MQYQDHDIEKICELIGDKKKEMQARNGVKSDFLFFADFDGTILCGDMTDGMKDKESSGRLIKGYQGLAEICIRRGISDKYRGEEGFHRFQETYLRLVEEDAAYSANFCAQLFNDLNERRFQELEKVVIEYLRETLVGKIYHSAMVLINRLQANGIKVFVTSASPKLFIKPLQHLLPIPKERLWGVSPSDSIINYGDGKKQRILLMLKEKEKSGEVINIVGGMGNSVRSDGPFLEEISKRGGVSLLINEKVGAWKSDADVLTVEFQEIIQDYLF